MADLHPGDVFNQDPHQLAVGQLSRGQMGVTGGLEEPRYAGLSGAYPFNIGPYDGEHRSLTFTSDIRRGNMLKISVEVQQLTYFMENFYTRILCPIVLLPYNAEGVYWEQINYQRALPHHRADLGHTRTLTYKKTGGAAGLTQFSLGVDMEKAFQNTPEGQREYANGIRQIVTMFIEHLKLRVLDAILNAHRLNGEYQKNFNYYRAESIAASVEKRIRFWGIVQREKNGIEKMDIEVTSFMDRTNGLADTYVMPAKISEYYKITPSAKTDYYIAGNAGPANVRDAITPMTSINQSGVYLVREMLVANANDPTLYKPFRMMIRIEEIGEFYKMMERHRSAQQRFRAYHSSDLDIKILDGSADAWVKFTLRDAIDNSYLFDETQDGHVVDIEQAPYHMYQSHIPGASGHRHLFNYQTPDGKFEKCSLFGHMEHIYFNTSDVINLATAAYHKLIAEFGGADKVEEIYRAGMSIIEELEARDGTNARVALIPLVPVVPRGGQEGGEEGLEVESRIQSDIGYPIPANRMADLGTLLDQARPSNQTLFKIKQLNWKHSADLSTALGDVGLASWRGLESERAAAPFIRLIKSFVDKLEYFFPSSFVLNEKYASTWTSAPSKYSTFFENVILPNRVPLFAVVKTGGRVSTGSVSPTEIENVIPWNGVLNVSNDTNDHYSKLRNTFSRFMYRALFSMITEPLRRDAKVEGFMSKLPDRGDPKTIVGEVKKIIQKIVRQVPGTFLELRRDDKVLTDKVNATLDQLLQVYNETAAPIKGGLQRAISVVRTELLVSPAFARTLAQNHEENHEINFLPADPDFPEVPITIEKLRHILSMRGGEAFAQSRQPKHGALINESVFNTIFSPLMVASSSAAMQFGASLDVSGLGGGSGIGNGTGSDDLSYQQQEYAIGTAFREEEYEQGEHFSSRKPRVTKMDVHKIQKMGEEFFYGNINLSSVVGLEQRSIPFQHLDALKDVDFWLNTPIFQYNVAKLWKDCSHPILRALGLVYFCTPITRHALNGMVTNDIPIPIGFLFVRPHMAFEVLDAVKMRAGKETGTTYVQKGLAMAGDDATTQFSRMTYNNRSAVVIYRPENVFILRSIMIAGYHGGMDGTFINPATYHPTSIDGHAGSIIVLPIPYTEYVRGPFSLTGFWNVGEADENENEIEASLHYTTAAWCNALWGWNDARKGVNAIIYDPFTARSNANAIVYQGQTIYMNTNSHDFDIIEIGKGHLGKYVYPGCMKVYKGELTEFDPNPTRGYRPE